MSLMKKKKSRFLAFRGATKDKKREAEHIQQLRQRTDWYKVDKKSDEADKDCSNCAYSDNETFQHWSCVKFGFDLTCRLNLAEECTSFTTVKEYERQCLRGELDSDFVTCPYCQIEYDGVKQAKCPNCGAYPRGK